MACLAMDTTVLTQLRQLLVDHYSEGELRTLCFDLGVDYESLPPGGKADKARELVAYLERRDRILDLLQVGQRLRPDVDWSQIYLDDRMADYRARRDQADQLRRERRERQRVVNLRPLDVTHTFKDRVREMQELCSHLAQGDVRLVSIVGRGGMGKTALVSHVLADLEETWFFSKNQVSVDGILYLSARSTGLSLERIYTDVGRMLGEPTASRLAARWASGEIPLVAKVEYLLEMMQDGLYLILLDNLEDHLSPDGTIADEGLRLFVEHGLTQPGGVRLIATSREQVQVASAALRNARHIPLRDGLPESEAMALLCEFDPSGELGLRDALEDDLRRAVQLTGGIPRALEIITGILQADPTISLPRLLADKSLFGEQVVESLVAAGYHRLGESERRVMETLAVFDCPIEETAIAYLLYPWYPNLDVRGCLRRLANGYFVSVNRNTGAYSLHPLDREYAYGHLPNDEEPNRYNQRNLELRAADFYVSIRKPKSEWKTIEDLAPQLAEFEYRVRAGDYDGAGRVLELIDYDHLLMWAHYVRLIEMGEKLLGRLGDLVLQEKNLESLGRAHRALGHMEQSAEFFQQAIMIARQIGDQHSEGRGLGFLGLIYRYLGLSSRAIEFYEDALVLAREVGDHQSQITWLGNLGLIQSDLGQANQAIKFYNQALVIAREIAERREEELWLGFLGLAYRDLGEIGQALDLCTKALFIAREIGDRRRESIWLSSLGIIYYGLEQIEQATGLFQESLVIVREIGSRLGESHCLLGLGKVYLADRNFVAAQQCCMEALTLDIPETNYQAELVLGIVLLSNKDSAAKKAFVDAATRCHALLAKTTKLHRPRYAMAAALIGQAVCDPRWADASQRAELLAPALAEYRRALEITAALGVVGDAIRDLELIRKAGIEGLEPVFELLQQEIADVEMAL